MIRVAWLPGDGVGREVTDGPVTLLRSVAGVEVSDPLPVGATGAAETGHFLPSETLAACRDADAVLLGAVGDDPDVDRARFPRPELGLLELRRELDLRVSVREVLDPRASTSTTVVRNLLGGAYVDDDLRQESIGEDAAIDQLVLRPDDVAEVARIACDHAARTPDRRAVSVDKASVYATSRLWRRVVDEVSALRGTRFEHLYVDRAAFELASPDRPLPGVVLTEGLFGDILSDLLCGRAGSPALCGSASLRPDPDVRCRGLFEPAHGSAPRRARQDSINPTGAFLAVAMLLETFPATASVGESVRHALDAALADPLRTYDLARAGPTVGTRAFAERVLDGVELAATVPGHARG